MFAWGDDSVLETTLVGDGVPALSLVDDLARLQLAVRRAGGRMWLEDVTPGVVRLLELAGLRGKVGGETESGEDALDVQE